MTSTTIKHSSSKKVDAWEAFRGGTWLRSPSELLNVAGPGASPWEACGTSDKGSNQTQISVNIWQQHSQSTQGEICSTLVFLIPSSWGRGLRKRTITAGTSHVQSVQWTFSLVQRLVTTLHPTQLSQSRVWVRVAYQLYL